MAHNLKLQLKVHQFTQIHKVVQIKDRLTLITAYLNTTPPCSLFYSQHTDPVSNNNRIIRYKKDATHFPYCMFLVFSFPCRCGFLLHLRHSGPSPQHPCPPAALLGGRLLAEPLLPGRPRPAVLAAAGAQPGRHGRLRPGLLPLPAVEDVTAAAGHGRAPAQQQPGSSRHETL